MKKIKIIILFLICFYESFTQDSIFYYSNMYALDTTLSAEYFEIDITISEHFDYKKKKKRIKTYLYPLDSIHPKMVEKLAEFVKKEDIILVNSVNNSKQKTSTYYNQLNLHDYTYRIYLDNEQQVLDLIKKVKFKGLKGISGKAKLTKETEEKVITNLEEKIKMNAFKGVENIYGKNKEYEIYLTTQSFSENIFNTTEIISEFKILYQINISRKGYLNFTIKLKK